MAMQTTCGPSLYIFDNKIVDKQEQLKAIPTFKIEVSSIKVGKREGKILTEIYETH